MNEKPYDYIMYNVCGFGLISFRYILYFSAIELSSNYCFKFKYVVNNCLTHSERQQEAHHQCRTAPLAAKGKK